MCGICGIYNFDPQRQVNRSGLEKMARTLHHRGPDDEGFHVDGSLGLGHRRLSIIDLSQAGHPAITKGDGRLWIRPNGETYHIQGTRQGLG